MVLKTQTDYALRTLIYLAHVNKQVPLEDISTAYAISKDHLVKIVQQLVRLGYVISRAGRTGGIRLSREPVAINCGKVIADFEGRHGLLPCVNDLMYCRMEPGCFLRLKLMEAEKAFYDVFDALTIADLLKVAGPAKGGLLNLTIGGYREANLAKS